MELQYVNGFFGTARERYQIKLNREAGQPWPWTEDKQFRQWRFCQVHREDDRTTVWFRENVRKHLRGLAAVKATVAFRWFNRVETGELLVDLLVDEWDSEEARRRLQGISPVVTGAYIIKGYDGYSKLDGVLKCIDEAFPQLEAMVSMWERLCEEERFTLRVAWNDLTTLNYLGGFMAYEIISDLRWCDPFDQALDIMTWANAGPGCARGLSWTIDGCIGRFATSTRDQKQMLPLMQHILDMSKDEQYWPQEWKKWEMREVEHWSCEWDKYCRARSGDSMKRKYTPPPR
jgi:hypothetical protein